MTDYLLLTASVLAGGALTFLLKNNNRFHKFLLTFSGAYLFAVIVFHLLPEIYRNQTFGIKTTGLFLLTGLIFQLTLDFFSHGLEHGHEQGQFQSLRTGLITGLFLHAFTEGLPVHQLHSHAYLHAILIHKLPIAMVLTAFVMQSGNLTKTLLILIAFSLMSPLGTWAGEHFEALKQNTPLVSAFVTGVLTHVSTTILFESDRSHQFRLKKFATVILAFTLAYFM